MKKSIGMILLLFFISLFSMNAFATDTYSTTNTSTVSDLDRELEEVQAVASSQTEDVTIEEAEKWAERKGFELVGLLQKVVQPFAIIIFIVCAFMSLAGAFGNSQLVGRGIFGMFIAVLMYAVVLYAPEIMDSVLGWLTS